MNATQHLSLGPWTADLALGLLSTEHATHQLSPRGTALLRALAEEVGSVVPTPVLRAQLQLDDPEPVSIHVLRRTVIELRAALAATAPPSVTLDTVAKRGYRLMLPAVSEPMESEPLPPAPHTAPIPAPAPSRWPDLRTLALVASALLALATPFAIRALAPASLEATPAAADEPAAQPERIVLAFDDVQLLERDPGALAMATQLGTRVRQAIRVIDRGLGRHEPLVIDVVRSNVARPANPVAARAEGSALEAAPTHRLTGALQRQGPGWRIRFALHNVDEPEPLYVFQESVPADEDSDRAIQRYAAQVADGLQILLDPHAREHMKSLGTRSVDAYRLFVEAQANTVFPISGTVLRRKNRMFAEALAIDESFSAALEAHTDVYTMRGRLELDPRVRAQAHEELQAWRRSRTLAAMDPGFEHQMDVALALLEDLSPSERAPLVLQEQLFSATTRWGTPLPLDLVDMLIGARLHEQAGMLLARFPKTNREGWNVDRRDFVLLLRKGAAAALPAVRESLGHDIAGDAIATVLLQATGEPAQADRALGRVLGADNEGWWAAGTIAQMRALGGRQARLATADAHPAALPWFVGNAAFMRGDVATGVEAWRDVGASETTIASFYQPLYELAFPATVTKDPRYQAALDRLGIGRRWTAQMQRLYRDYAAGTALQAMR